MWKEGRTAHQCGKEKDMYYVYGINSMGSTWYTSNKGCNAATLWSGGPREMRATYTKEEAKAEIARLNDINKWGSTRHYMESADCEGHIFD